MKDAHSISTRRAYGVQRVCRVWHRARSSVYARRQATTSRAPCRRRGPVGAAPDDVLAGHIRRLFTVNRLGLPASLRTCLTTTNIIDSTHSGIRQRTRRVTNWKMGTEAAAEMALRVVGRGLRGDGEELPTHHRLRAISGC